jgi:DNA-binding transcriptional MerR regulator
MTFEEAANLSGISINTIEDFVVYSWIKPKDEVKRILDQEDIERIKLISELKHMDVNDESISIILHLVDQLNVIQYQISLINK